MFNFLASPLIPKKPSLRCVVRLKTSMYRTKRGIAVRKDLELLKRKTELSISDLFDIPEGIQCIENIHTVEDGVYEIVPSCWSGGTWEMGYEDDEVETWKLIPYCIDLIQV